MSSISNEKESGICFVKIWDLQKVRKIVEYKPLALVLRYCHKSFCNLVSGDWISALHEKNESYL